MKVLKLFIKLISVCLVLTMCCTMVFSFSANAATENIDISANYNKLREHIEKKGEINSVSKLKTLTFEAYSASEGGDYMFSMANGANGIEFEVFFLADGGSHFNSFILSDKNEYISCSVNQVFVKNGTSSIATATAEIERSKYSKTYEILYTITYYESTAVKNALIDIAPSSLYLLCGEAELYLYKTLGFGLYGLGFYSFLDKSDCKNHSYGAYTKLDKNQHQQTCLRCGHVEKKNHSWDKGVIKTNATCKEEGTKLYTCTLCKDTKEEVIVKTNNHSFGNWVQIAAPSCTENGEENRVCLICNTIETRAIKSSGHTLVNETITKQPTCTETGTKNGECTVCKKTVEITLEATGHLLDEGVITLEPTCTTEGTTEKICLKCNEKIIEPVSKKEHTFGAETIVKESTTTEKGLKEKSCSVCGYKVTEELPLIEKDNTETTVKDDSISPKTGDKKNVIFCFALLIISALGVILTATFNKKELI